MSGICGEFNLDGGPVDDSDIRVMTRWLERRGPDGTSILGNGSFGCGHSLLATTPESSVEHQPFADLDSGCVITADARLDYRDELIAQLGIERRLQEIGDAELILRSYLRWGEQCPARLLGDYAFAIWNPRERRLFCARDPFGMRPLCYHYAPGRRFVFASDTRAILLLTEVPHRVSEERIADFLVPSLEWIDYESTFFEGVFRLPSAHSLTVGPDDFRIREHWTPQPGPELGSLSDNEYIEGFVEAFKKAIEWRLRAPKWTVGSMLSGGMDSGSVVAFAKELARDKGEVPFPTYSLARSTGIKCAESRSLRASQGMPSLEPTTVIADEVGSEFSGWLSGYEEPFDTEYNFLRALYSAAQVQGRRVVLDGGGGDLTLAEGTYIARLIRHGHLRRALAEIRGELRFWGFGSLTAALLLYTRGALVPAGLKKAVRRFLPAATDTDFMEDSMISPDLARRVDIGSRISRYRETFAREWTPDYALESCNAIRPNVTGGRERYARIAAGVAVEPRDPYLDQRLIAYCTRLPGRFRMRDGWYKWILRHVTAGLLPDEVRWMRGKPHIGWAFSAAVNAAAINRGSLSLVVLKSELEGYIEARTLDLAWRHFHDNTNPDQLLKAHALSIWLRENVTRPVVSDAVIR